MKTLDRPYTRTTEQFAELHGIKPQSVRAQVCRTGSYYGVTPRRLVNGRLMWPDNQVQSQNKGEVA